MKLQRFLSIIIGVLIFAMIISCETIYNYDLSLSGLDSLPATKSCILKYLPKNIDALKGQQYHDIEMLGYELDNYSTEIIDSLRADSIFIDTSYILNFVIIGLDPYDEVTEVPVSKTYLPPN